MKIKGTSAIRDEMVDREAIRDCLFRYARGADRCDADLIRGAYWPDAHDDHLEFSGTPEAFIEYAMPRMTAMRHTQHTIGNILIAIDGNKADVESYFQGYHSIPFADGRRDVFAGGRYLDNFEKRGQDWRIIKRFVMTDWFREFPDTADWDGVGPFNGMKGIVRGVSSTDDKSYELLKLLR